MLSRRSMQIRLPKLRRGNTGLRAAQTYPNAERALKVEGGAARSRTDIALLSWASLTHPTV